jgi:hypothetical protein
LLALQIVLLGLEFLILSLNVLVERLDEQVVDFLSERDLSHLKFSQIVRQHGISEVLMNHLLEQLHIIGIELRQTIVNHSSNICIFGLGALKTLHNV